MALFGKSKKDYQSEIEQLQAELQQTRAMLTPEMADAIQLQHRLNALNMSIENRQAELYQINTSLNNAQQELAKAKDDLIQTNEEVLMQEFGLYTPRFNFANSDQYKERLSKVREDQKMMIKNGRAVTGNMLWTVNNSAKQGQRMVKDMQKLLLRAFNTECDEIINKVKYNNLEASQKRILKSRDAISKLGRIMEVSISQAYCDSKLSEMYLAFEYATKKQEEKEAIREAKAEMREAAKLQKEIEEQRKAAEKERLHYENAVKALLTQIEANGETAELMAKKAELEAHLGDIDAKMKDLDYREANKRAGYVYIISNIGSFGKDVYKIGMTRRLDPMDRVYELGDASVPFNFDVHAMIFSDDAPSLENALHHAFENRKVNMVNQRREFFHVTLDEIKEVIRQNFDKTVDFTDVPDAEQFRESLLMRKQLSASNS